jgi:broad specificity phosphatase PhoE
VASLYLIRHAPTKLNKPGNERVRGWLSVPPDPESLKHWLQEVGEALKGKGIRFVASSDLARGRESARALARHLGVERVVATPELRTWNTGDYEGERYRSADPSLRHHIENPDEEVPGGEPFGNFVERWKRGYGKLVDHVRRTGENGAVVVHGNELMALPAALRQAQDGEQDRAAHGAAKSVKYISHEDLPRPGSIFEIRIDKGARPQESLRRLR